MPIPEAHATSAYDGLINQASQLVIYSPGSSSSSIDISTNWRSIVAQCNSTASASLEDAIQHQGHWMVLIENPGIGADAYIRWTSDTSTSAKFLMYGTDPYWGTSAGNYAVLRLNYVTNTGASNCDYYPNVTRVADDGFISISSASRLPIFLSTFPLTYPAGYAGVNVPYGPTFGPITGQVECFNNNDQVNSVRVTPSSGISGNAALSGVGGSTIYTYYPSEFSNTYQLSIDCGGTLQGTTPVNIDPNTYSYPIWYCSTAVQSSCYLQ